MPRPLLAMAVLFVALVPACTAPQDSRVASPAPRRARLALAPFGDETRRGAGPLAEGLRLFLEEALSREPALQVVRRPDDQADLLLRGALLEFRPLAGSDPPVLVTELGLLDVRNGALVISRIVRGAGPRGPEMETAIPGPLRHWAGTAAENLVRVWLASALVMLREAVPAGYFVYDAAGKPVASLPPPPPRRQRPAASDLPPGAPVPTATVTAERADVREGPGPPFPILGHLKRGEGVQVLDERGDWSNVRTPGGLEGWVFRGSLTPPRVLPPGGPPGGSR